MENGIEIKVVQNKQDRRLFVELPWIIYSDDPNWVPPLLTDMHDTLNQDKNALLRLGPNRFFLAVEKGRVVGRLGVGIDNRLNREKNQKLSYITLFESIEDYTVAKALFDTGLKWLKEQGAEIVTGPQSPSNGDDYRGLLIDGFKSPPVLLNSYNPPYYEAFLERYGFSKQFDRFAYYFDFSDGPPERLARGVAIAEKRYGFTARSIDFKRMDREIRIIKEVVEESMPDWPDMIPPGDAELYAEAAKLKQLARPELVIFIESKDGKCLGFAVTLPDYNEILKRLNGRLLPLGIFRYLYYRRKISGVRMFALFVTPGGRRRGVSAALYYYSMLNALKLGYTRGEGSTIHEFNARMNIDARKAGGRLYKTYRVYQLLL